MNSSKSIARVGAGVDRRSFLGLAAGGAALWAGGCSSLFPSKVPPVTGRMRHAGIGVGGMGYWDLKNIAEHPDVDVVALCDVDATKLEAAAELAPNARLYSDWRVLLQEEAGELDAVHVSTPDHMHAPIAMGAIREGLHVYCQKPLTHTVVEARLLTRAARRRGVVTEMGIQNRSGLPYRRAFEVFRTRPVGPIREVHVWSDRPKGWWPQGIERPEGEDPIPETLDWDAWLGVAPARPYKEGAYHPFAWRGWMDFGTGAQGDMACHLMDPALWFLGLDAPTRVWSDGPAPGSESFPEWSTVHYSFPPTPWTWSRDVRLTWYDGGVQPTELLASLGVEEPWANACLFVGEEGAFLSSPYEGYRLLPEERHDPVPEPELAEVNHWHLWVEACFGRGLPAAGFEQAGPLTEVALLGNVALRFPQERLDWDARRLRFPNRPEANAYLRKDYRPGWGGELLS